MKPNILKPCGFGLLSVVIGLFIASLITAHFSHFLSGRTKAQAEILRRSDQVALRNYVSANMDCKATRESLPSTCTAPIGNGASRKVWLELKSIKAVSASESPVLIKRYVIPEDCTESVGACPAEWTRIGPAAVRASCYCDGLGCAEGVVFLIEAAFAGSEGNILRRNLLKSNSDETWFNLYDGIPVPCEIF
jgi:hypothetical protein